MFKEEIKKRLQLQEGTKPDIVFPEGCYGAANAPLVFVGPSPGGGKTDTEYSKRNEIGGSVYWNFEFNEPFTTWSNGFRVSLGPIIESLTQIPLNEGSNKLFAFVNFDWIQNPNSSKVPIERINEGVEGVSKTLHRINPQIIVALDTKSYKNLIILLTNDGYSMTNLKKQKVKVRTASSNSFHRKVDAHVLKGEKSLNGSVLLRSPQHPARIYDENYSLRIAKTLKDACSAILGGGELRLFLN